MALTKDGQRALWIFLVIIVTAYSVFFGHYKTILIYLLVIFFVYIYVYGHNDKISEDFHPWHYRPIHYMPTGVNKYYRMDYVPPIILPPHYGDLGVIDYPKIGRYPISYNSMYCAKNPLCYPCPGWKYIGPPYCSS